MIKNAFFDRFYLPNCVGIMDGTHIPISVHKNVSTAYFNYKGYTSMNALVLVDHMCKFTYVLSGSKYIICLHNIDVRNLIYVKKS